MWNFLVGLVFLLIVFIIFGSFSIDVIREAINEEKKRLAREKEELLARQKIKERLRTLLLRKFNWRLYLGYCGLLIGFMSATILSSYVMNYGYDLNGLGSGAVIVEIAILLISLFGFQKPVEFKYILTKFAPILKRRIFREHPNINEEIEATKASISEVEEKILILDRIVLA